MIERAELVLSELMDGNRRFREGRPRGHRYVAHHFRQLAAGQAPSAAVVTCSDSRVDPDLIFDTVLGTLLVGRVPGNVASESIRWLVDMAIGELKVPLVLVVGHTHCRAVQQILEGKPNEYYEPLERGIEAALEKAKAMGAADLYRQVIIENVRQTVADLRDEPLLRVALANGQSELVGALYEIETGRVIPLET